MIWLALGCIVLALALLAGERSANADVHKLASQLRLAGGWGALGLSGFFVLSGRVVPGLVLGGAGLALLARRRLKLQQGPAPHQQGGNGAGAGPKQASPPPAQDKDAISRAEAVLLLGLVEPFTHDEVRQAHRKLMMQHHPDQGGDTKLAARLNAAKTHLLGE